MASASVFISFKHCHPGLTITSKGGANYDSCRIAIKYQTGYMIWMFILNTKQL
jgi:hypothetical protein